MTGSAAPRSSWSGLVADPRHGPLPALLLGLTVVTGLVDAVSILALGRVFVANMTGNVVFIGFALAGASGFSLSASLSALGGFLVGAFAGGLIVGRTGSDRGRLLLSAVGVELALLVVCAVIGQVTRAPYGDIARDTLAGLLAVAMGIQNAAARRLAVPDLTTTVLTMTLTGLAADVRDKNHAALVRRVLAVSTMLGGAVGGALLTDRVRAYAALDVAAAVMLFVTMAAGWATRRSATWRTAASG